MSLYATLVTHYFYNNEIYNRLCLKKFLLETFSQLLLTLVEKIHLLWKNYIYVNSSYLLI